MPDPTSFEEAKQVLLKSYLKMAEHVDVILHISSRKRDHVDDFRALEDYLFDASQAVKVLRSNY
jgi:uncharacterized phage-like protein YoqJ